ncbi:helix-turn-helix domain-containing protein [Oenococcus sp.]|uniref:helix-turn-helix domain-containing protein n=1 Tax=Oenococcus sp. TaxID=1979414 RepID=UPI0039EC3338
MAIGPELKEQRQKNKLSQQQVANQLNVTRQTVSSWEQGRTIPDPDSLQKLRKLYYEDNMTGVTSPVAKTVSSPMKACSY